MKRIVAVLGLVVLLGPGCASAPARHRATLASLTIYGALGTLQDTENALFAEGVITAEQHKQINAKLVPLLETGLAYNNAVLAWKAGDPVPPQLPGLIERIGAMIETLSDFFPDGVAKARLLSQIAIVQQTILAILPFFSVQPASWDELVTIVEVLYE